MAPYSSAKQPLPPPLTASGIEKWKEGDTFSTVMQEYSFYKKGKKLSPRKRIPYLFVYFFFMNGNAERAQCVLSQVCIP